MSVVRFSSEYGEVAPLYSMDPEELRDRDVAHGQPVQRWFTRLDGRANGAVSTWLRPDDRMFLTFKTEDLRSIGPLTDAVAVDLDRSLSTIVDLGDGERVAALLGVGFTVDQVSEAFRVPFSVALDAVHRAWVPSGYRIVSVADVDVARGLALDNRIRNLVPGTEGWIGDPDWFRDELRSPEFDGDGYLIAIDQATDQYVGLLRIWRNPNGPRLGLLGVVPEHRRQPVAASLLKQGLHAASTWGSDSFVTETSLNNRVVHSRLRSLGGEPFGRFAQLTRR